MNPTPDITPTHGHDDNYMSTVNYLDLSTWWYKSTNTKNKHVYYKGSKTTLTLHNTCKVTPRQQTLCQPLMVSLNQFTAPVMCLHHKISNKRTANLTISCIYNFKTNSSTFWSRCRKIEIFQLSDTYINASHWYNHWFRTFHSLTSKRQLWAFSD